MSKLILLELNEINFEHLRVYAARGELPHISQLINEHGVVETISESRYEELEPWIQWVTAHTGLTLTEHGIFRLGDISHTEILQIWEALEEQGLSVGAISPMNAKNRCRHAAFFVPDPWTSTKLTARPLLRKLYRAIAQAVNDNAQSRLAARSLVWLLLGAAIYARPVNYAEYVKIAWAARTKPWFKAMLLDLLLADVFIRETVRKKPDFTSLFVNAGAHIQHHYMFNSVAYRGSLKNPKWYAPTRMDPIADVYRLYDRIVGQVQTAFPEARLMVATGLHQDPHSEVTYYWRLRDHKAFLEKHDVPFVRVEPRMSRDFLIVCKNASDAKSAERILGTAKGEMGIPLFEVDNRGSDLFVMLTYPHEIGEEFVYMMGNEEFGGLREDVAFVAIKNGQHNGIGYFVDSGTVPGELPEQFPLTEMPSRISEALEVKWPAIKAEAAE